MDGNHDTSHLEWVQTRVAAALEGDSAAYGDLIYEYQSSLRGFIAMLGVRSHAVEDIAQDTFVIAYQRLASFQPDRSFGAWLRGIARNRVKQWWDQNRREVGVGEAEIADFLMFGELRISSLQQEADYRTPYLRQCLEKLSERSRRMVELRYFDRRKSADIARLLSMEPTAVRMALHRIRLTLRDCIDALAAAEGAV